MADDPEAIATFRSKVAEKDPSAASLTLRQYNEEAERLERDAAEIEARRMAAS
jgi:hypothetical protein